MHKALLQKTGNLFVTALPAEIIENLHLHAGQQFEVTLEDNRIVLTPSPASATALEIHEEMLNQYYDAFQQLARV